MNNNSQTTAQTQKKDAVAADGKTGTHSLTQKPIIMAAIDSHMHIQSGHVGTLPFGLGMKWPLGLRKLTYDIPNHIFYERFQRKYLDDNAVDFYNNAFRPCLEDIAVKADRLSKKYKSKASEIEKFRKSIQNEIIAITDSLFKFLHKLCLNYGELIDDETKMVIGIVGANVEMLVKMAKADELILFSAGSVARRTSEAADSVTAQAKERAGLILGMILNIATIIVDFHLNTFSLFCDFGASALRTFRETLSEVYTSLLELIMFLIQRGKALSKLVEQEIIKIFGESVLRIAQFSTINFLLMEMWEKAKSYILAYISEFAHKNSTIGIGEFLAIQKEKTLVIGGMAVKGNDNSIIPICQKMGADATNVFAPLLVMPMDLDFAHLDRFEPDIAKATVYRYANIRYNLHLKIPLPGLQMTPAHEVVDQILLLPPETPQEEVQNLRKSSKVEEEKGDFYYFNSRLSGVKDGQLFWVHPTEFKVYEHWKIQREDTIAAVKNFPWQIVPLYHFEPRRYTDECEEAFQYIMDKGSKSGNSQSPRLFVGIKMYPNLGYKPLDTTRLPILKTLYKKCVEKEIPIMTHGGPNGSWTHDRPLFYESDTDPNTPTYRKTSATVPNKELDSMKGEEKSLFYFMQEYASPYAWENVLKVEEYNNLRLCIAHFGGSDNRPDSTKKNKKYLSGWDVPINPKGAWDESVWNQKIIAMMIKYPNLYTDISCMENGIYLENLPKAIIRWPDLRKRIMFGTDWYMTELSLLPYPAFIAQAKKGLDAVDKAVRKSGNVPQNDPSIWQWFTEINPFRFYRFDRIAEQYTKELIDSIQSDPFFKDDKKAQNKNIAENSCKLIFAIAKRLKAIGELPDAITSSKS